MSAVEIFWAVVELMGRVQLSGRVTSPGEGGLWRIDVPDGETYRTEFFSSQAVYRIRPVSEEIARVYARPGLSIIEYNPSIVSREIHEEAVRQLKDRISELVDEIEERDQKALGSGDEDQGINQ